MTRLFRMIQRIFKYFFITLGCLFLLQIVLCFTSAPFWIWYGMSTKYAGISRPPQYIVVLGGGGMPGETGFMRCWYASGIGNHFRYAKLIIALPGDTLDRVSSVCRMKEELMLRGISADRIRFEPAGTNTRAQALNIKKLITNYELRITDTLSIVNCQLSIPVLIVTSPEHLYRAVKTFKKVGFTRVDGLPAFEAAIESDITFDDVRLGGHKWLPHIGRNITLRYRFWTQLHYEELVIREWVATVYYWLKGWI